MNFIVDAHLPVQLCTFLASQGHDALHVSSLPQGYQSSDKAIREIAVRDSRVIVTKDSDFVDDFWLLNEAWKLLFITTGNISNVDLIAIFTQHLATIVSLLNQHDLVEIDRTRIVVHK